MEFFKNKMEIKKRITRGTMNNNYFKIVFTICLVFISTNLFGQSEKEVMMKKIEEWNKTFSAAMAAGDNKTILSFYADDAYSLPSYSPMMIGKVEIRASMVGDTSGTKFNYFKLNTKDIWLSGNLLCEVGNYYFSMIVPGAPKPLNDNGKYITIYEKQKDGSWKIKADMWNTDLNPWAQMEQ